jgi:hypothetical protein
MTIYVDIRAPREGNGRKESPFRHIDDAARIARPGDEVLVAPGDYREDVNPRNPGREDARITYRSTEPLGAVITGAEEARGWVRQDSGVWRLRVNNAAFGAYNPYTTLIKGDWYFGPFVRHTGAVYLNDRQLYEVQSLEACVKGEPYPHSWEPEWASYLWYTEQEGDWTVIYANFRGADPNRERVEINVRRNCFMPAETGVGYITVSGFRMEKAATTWAPPAAYQDGMIGPHWSKGWIIEDCEISNSRCCGISLGKYRDPENDMYFTTRHVKSPTQMERDAVCRGQYHGWLKENIGHHIIRSCDIHHCEQTGIVGRMGGVFSTIEDCHIHDICNSQQLGGAETAGIKLHAAIDVTIRRNHIHHCIMGVWCDWQAQGARISQNLMHDNDRPEGLKQAPGAMFNADVFIEVGHGPTLIDNNILLSDVSLRIATQSVAMVHNLICGALTYVGGGTGPRYTPYHMPHRTEVMGFMTILHGDDRFYNNIFVQKWPAESFAARSDSTDRPLTENREVGTHVWDGYPTYDEWIAQFDMDTDTPNMGKLAPAHESHLPVWIDGNVYFNGAKAWAKEQHNRIDTEHTVSVDVVEKDGKPVLETDLYQYLDGFRCGMIDSDILGCAFEPNQRFENPDGTAIRFDADYLGDHRGIEILPGPFAAEDGVGKALWF